MRHGCVFRVIFSTSPEWSDRESFASMAASSNRTVTVDDANLDYTNGPSASWSHFAGESNASVFNTTLSVAAGAVSASFTFTGNHFILSQLSDKPMTSFYVCFQVLLSK